ncbi:hypothetical protein [Methanosalsum natronophilum]|nr:hypothetical protein [Methanosalsum natronophilum]MCS3923875.1 hypothetical protein [Methanosalsum natronophilum]
MVLPTIPINNNGVQYKRNSNKTIAEFKSIKEVPNGIGFAFDTDKIEPGERSAKWYQLRFPLLFSLDKELREDPEMLAASLDNVHICNNGLIPMILAEYSYKVGIGEIKKRVFAIAGMAVQGDD